MGCELNKTIAVTPTVSTTPNYTTDDAIGGSMEFSGAARVTGGGGFIQKIIIINNSIVVPKIDLVLFDQSFTASTDNAAFDPSDADLANVIHVENFLDSDWNVFNDNSVAERDNLSIPFVSNAMSLFGQMVWRSGLADDFDSTSDLTVKITVIQN